MMYWNFYLKNAPGVKRNLIHEGIGLVSSPEVHVETQFTDGLSFSSQYGVGPRFMDIKYSHPERWDRRPLWWMSGADEYIARYRAQLWVQLREAGLSDYDTRGAIGSAWTGCENPWDPFCSEACYEILPDTKKIVCLNYKLHPHKLLEVYHAICEAHNLIT